MPSDATDDDDEPSALEEAFLRYDEAGLRLPPVPRELADELDEFVDWRWGSEDLNLEDVDGFLEGARAPGGDSEVGFGHVGHGVSSWWLCYRLKLDAIAVFVRLAFGGAYGDSEAELARANAIAATLEEMIPAAAAAKKAGRFQGGHRLVVVMDEKGDKIFWEVAGGPEGPQRSRSPIEDAMDFLSRPVLAG